MNGSLAPETRYGTDHIWIRLHADRAAVGLTSFAVEVLGVITAVRLPDPGTRVKAGDPCAAIESVKAASDVCAPVAGRVVRPNPAALGSPALVNEDPEGAGWLYEMMPDDPGAIPSLMDAAAYNAFIRAL